MVRLRRFRVCALRTGFNDFLAGPFAYGSRIYASQRHAGTERGESEWNLSIESGNPEAICSSSARYRSNDTGQWRSHSDWHSSDCRPELRQPDDMGGKLRLQFQRPEPTA